MNTRPKGRRPLNSTRRWFRLQTNETKPCGFWLVTDDFRLLFDLIEPRPPEVGGRVALAISSELRAKIARFAAGKSNEDERTEMKRTLREKPELIPALADEVRALRQSDQ
jgi:hypothetical protein